MYPGPSGAPENHKRSYCADGVRQKPKPESADISLPDWPQPHGIFVNGTEFHALTFLSKVRELYDKVVDCAAGDSDYSMEDEAFSRMLSSRTIFSDNHVLFRLFDLDTIGSSASLIEELEGLCYLRMDCLSPA